MNKEIKEKKRMLLFGPGYGHNAEGKLRALNDNPLFEVDYLAYQLDKAFMERYPNICFKPLKNLISINHPLSSIKCFLFLFWLLRISSKYDIIYSLGSGGAITSSIFFLAPRRTTKALEIWSIHIIDKAKSNKSISEKFDRYVIDHADFICQFWWGIREHFINIFPHYERKFIMYQLSYSDIYFSNERHSPTSVFAKEFLSRIPEEQVVCFWPRSFIPSNNHKLLLDALGIVKRTRPELLEKFMLYLWVGNAESSVSRGIIENTIIDNSLENNVEIVEHPFVSQNDLFAIEERSNIFVNIVNDDIFSTYIMEMICSCKPFILSNIRTFQFLNEKYNLNIDLVENKEEIISERLVQILTGNDPVDFTEYKRRKQICTNLFSVSNVTRWYTILYNHVWR